MTSTTGDPPGHRYDFYANQYAHFASEVAVKIRREVYGEDLGQQGWRTLEEQAAIAELVAELLHCEDRTQATVDLASRWHAARERYADDLLKQESVEWFAQRQSFLAMTADLAVSRRLCRFF